MLAPAANPHSALVRGFGDLTGLGPSNEDDIVKRVAAVGGQRISCCDTQGRLLLDGKPVDEPYVYEDLPFGPGASTARRRPDPRQRVRNRQSYLKALMAQIAKPETLANPVTVSQIVSQFSPFLTVDSGLTSKAVAGLALEMKDIRPAKVVSFTLQTSGVGTSADGQSIVNFNQEATDALAAAMANGTVPQYVADRNLQNGQLRRSVRGVRLRPPECKDVGGAR